MPVQDVLAQVWPGQPALMEMDALQSGGQGPAFDTGSGQLIGAALQQDLERDRGTMPRLASWFITGNKPLESEIAPSVLPTHRQDQRDDVTTGPSIVLIKDAISGVRLLTMDADMLWLGGGAAGAPGLRHAPPSAQGAALDAGGIRCCIRFCYVAALLPCCLLPDSTMHQYQAGSQTFQPGSLTACKACLPASFLCCRI